MFYEIYGKIAKEIDDTTLVAGRSSIQKYAEPFIIKEIVEKLELTKEDSVLEIGCGLGNVMLPISCLVKKIYGIDHPEIINKLESSVKLENCEFIAGNWLDSNLKINDINKVIIYSVLHYLSGYEEAIHFIEKALSLLQSGGKILIGDLPNVDKKKRFLNSEYGQKFHIEWEKQRHQQKKPMENRRDEIVKEYVQSDSLILIDDETISRLMMYLRKSGYDVYLLPQANYLPFGNTREDLLIIKN